MLNVTDNEIEFFKNDMTEYETINTEIIQIKKKISPLQEKLKELNKKKLEKESEVLAFMKTNEIDACNANDKSYVVKETKTTRQVTKGEAYDKILAFFESEINKDDTFLSKNNEEKAKTLHSYIYIEGRESTTKSSLKTK